MTLNRTLADFTYRSGAAGTYYYFTVSLDEGGRYSVRDIQSPRGRIIDSNTALPQSVTDDIQVAIQQVKDLVAQTSAVNGSLTFTNETSKSVAFATEFAGTNYRVYLAVPDFVPYKVTAKTTTGFTVTMGVTYTGTVGYDVFV